MFQFAGQAAMIWFAINSGKALQVTRGKSLRSLCAFSTRALIRESLSRPDASGFRPGMAPCTSRGLAPAESRPSHLQPSMEATAGIRLFDFRPHWAARRFRDTPRVFSRGMIAISLNALLDPRSITVADVALGDLAPLGSRAFLDATCSLMAPRRL